MTGMRNSYFDHGPTSGVYLDLPKPKICPKISYWYFGGIFQHPKFPGYFWENQEKIPDIFRKQEGQGKQLSCPPPSSSVVPLQIMSTKVEICGSYPCDLQMTVFAARFTKAPIQFSVCRLLVQAVFHNPPWPWYPWMQIPLDQLQH